MYSELFFFSAWFYTEMNENYMYAARSQPDNRDICITGGWITEVQL